MTCKKYIWFYLQISVLLDVSRSVCIPLDEKKKKKKGGTH